MKNIFKPLLILFLLTGLQFRAQENDVVIQGILREVNENSQVELLAHELMDGIGPRLVGTPEMKQAHDWAVARYQTWGIQAKNETWGEWRGWQRGITHIDMISPRVKTLSGTQLAWSASTPKKGITAEVIILPEVKDSISFLNWLPAVKGKFVMIAMKQPTGRPDYNWEEFATKTSLEKMKTDREAQKKAWNDNLKRMGYTSRTISAALENAGAVGIIDSYWSNGFGANKIFSSQAKKIPAVDLALEDYTLLYRLVEHGKKPILRIHAESQELGMQPTFNTIAEIRGTEKPEEYIILSAHFDSWDGGTGATDNGTGTVVMMEVMRILKKYYPNPKRTILVGHWGSEEQGLNGSRAFVEDHPEITKNVQAVFNQDNGTGRVVNISGSGFLNSYDYLSRWLRTVPQDVKKDIKTDFPGMPPGGGSDHASFAAAGAPAFGLSSLGWSYGNYTWHTNLDTYDKIVFDDLKNNVILTAILAYMASEDPIRSSVEQRVLPLDKDGKPTEWPKQKSPKRIGGLN